MPRRLLVRPKRVRPKQSSPIEPSLHTEPPQPTGSSVGGRASTSWGVGAPLCELGKILLGNPLKALIDLVPHRLSAGLGRKRPEKLVDLMLFF